MNQVGSMNNRHQSVEPTAPSFEDLMVEPAPLAPPANSGGGAEMLDEDVILGIEGLSDEEKRVLLEEQRSIMRQIESEKTANAAAIASAQADAFESRSMSVAVRAATSSNSAVGGRTSGASIGGADADADEQVLTDEQLAEQLQKEEYERANNATRASQAQRRQQRAAAEAAQDSSWWGTVSSIFTAQAPGQEAPPASSPSTRGAGGGAPPSSSGAAPGGAGAARVAEKQPLFSCVVDSVAGAANTLGTALTAQTLDEDREGNVHGVDSSSLLAVPQVSRNNNPNNNGGGNSGGGNYY